MVNNYKISDILPRRNKPKAEVINISLLRCY